MLKEKYLKLNLQHFAEDDAEDIDNQDNTKDDAQDIQAEDKNNQTDTNTFTQEQVDKMIKDRISRAEKDKEKAIKEAEKLAKMSADQKKEYEFEKLQKENEELKKAQNRYELGKEATRILSESNIVATDEVLDFVVREDAETTNASVKAFSELVDKVVEEKVKEKLKGTSPKRQQGNNSGFKNPWSKEHFNLTEQGKIIKDDPALAKQLQGSR